MKSKLLCLLLPVLGFLVGYTVRNTHTYSNTAAVPITDTTTIDTGVIDTTLPKARFIPSAPKQHLINCSSNRASTSAAIAIRNWANYAAYHLISIDNANITTLADGCFYVIDITVSNVAEDSDEKKLGVLCDKNYSCTVERVEER